MVKLRQIIDSASFLIRLTAIGCGDHRAQTVLFGLSAVSRDVPGLRGSLFYKPCVARPLTL